MPEKKTVLVYRNELLPISETFIREQILALTGWRAVLIGRKRLNQLSLNDLDVRLVGPRSLALHDRLLWKAHRVLGTVPSHVRRLLSAEHPSLIHAHFGVDALDAWPLAKTLNLPMLVTLHGYDINIRSEWWEAGNAGTRLRSYPRQLLRLALQPQVSFIAVSEALRQRAIGFGIPAEKTALSYIGIDPTKYNVGRVPLARRSPQVLFVGRLVEKKGCQYLVEAMSAVQKEVPTAELVVVGDGPLRQDLELLAAKNGTRTLFRGAQTTAEVKRELDASRVLCLPSITASNGDAEGFGLVLLEAQASGVPVVTSALGGATEGIRDGVTGVSFAEGDVDALARILSRLLKNDTILVQMSECGPDFVATKFDLAKCARRLEFLYDAMCSSPHDD
jgi:glycosyltransferase involved in cell wall biosynthesis